MGTLEDVLPKDRVSELVFFVNGKKVIETCPDPEWTLLWYLRKKLQLTGSKYGCGEGGCGACTVMISQYFEGEKHVKHIAVNACLLPLCTLHGLAVTTVEGIGNAQDKLHPVQERIAKAHGSQCGFCTPGIVMSMYTLLRNKKKIDYEDIEISLQGNLCRCTGYRSIIDGFKTFLHTPDNTKENGEYSESCLMGKDCCKLKKKNEEVLFSKSEFKPYCSSQEPIFPPELILNHQYYKSFLYYRGKSVVWIRPQTLKELLFFKQEYQNSKIVVGNTEIGVEVKFKKKYYPILIYPKLITELNNIVIKNTCIELGAAVSLKEINCFLHEIIPIYKEKAKILSAIKDMLYYFAGDQIRNVACVAGNIVTASPISDLNPLFMACSAKIKVSSLKRGERTLVMDQNFFHGYRKVALEDDEIILAIEIPFTSDMQFFKIYKQARRKDDDISIVTAAFNVKLDKDHFVKEAKLCFGGMGPTILCASKTSEALTNLVWNEDIVNFAFKSLNEELILDSSVPGGMAEYRKSLCLSLFFRFYINVLNEIKYNVLNDESKDFCGSFELPRIQPKSSQCFEIKNVDGNNYNVVGKPLPIVSAIKQATGEAIYCDDIPNTDGELFLCLVLSTESYAKIISVDSSEAILVPDFVAFFSASDLLKDRNRMGPILKDEQIFADGIVTSRCCVIGAVVAKTEYAARKAKDLIKVTYEKLYPVILTIEEAILQGSFYEENPRKIEKGNVTEAFLTSTYVKDGFIRSGAQEHFYLETYSAYAVRKEDEIEVICTSQDPADIAIRTANVLGIPNHKVTVKVKRIGGGFGGKETRPAAFVLPVAIAAYNLKKPVRAVLDRDEDIQLSGYRHPCLIKYKVAFNGDGKIFGAIYDIYVNVGNYMDISCSMIERALAHVDNCYYIPNILVKGYLCKTNMQSNTAFRGFGAPKAMLAAEAMIRKVAYTLEKKYEDIVNINLYREGDLTHFNQMLTYCTLSRCWKECIERSNYWQRKHLVEDFNRSNRWKKKGLTIVPTKYGISFQTDLLMQGGSLLLVYKDGSVLLTIGGVEMGQGLFTKMIQVAARALEVDVARIHISEMSTDKIPNSQPTAGSMSSDLYGMAVLNACEVIKKRLEPYKNSNPNGNWENWVYEAYLDRVCLSATGFYAAPKIEYNRKTNFGNLYEYFTYGVACTEVIIDCLTGDHQVLRTDIVMDVGESLNPAIDIGQIEGAFIQGYGFFIMEEMIFAPNGEVLSKGPGSYKIPGFSDIPKEFNVSLLKGAPNPRAVYSSKAIGEPPLFLAASAYFALKEAIKSARVDAGFDMEFTLEVPATCARIRMACEDHITKQVEPTIKKGKIPWNIIP